MEKTVYELMHGEKGSSRHWDERSMHSFGQGVSALSIYLEDTAENDDLDIRMDNLTNFYYWCATRVLTLDRVYAKEIFKQYRSTAGADRP